VISDGSDDRQLAQPARLAIMHNHIVAIRWLRREEPIFKILRGGISRNWRTNHGLHRDLAGHNGGARLPVAAAVVISGTSTTSQPFPGPRRILAADRQKKMGSET